MRERGRERVARARDLAEAALTRVEMDRHRLRAAIQQVLDDEESRPGGWGPDVTMVAVLKAALEETG